MTKTLEVQEPEIQRFWEANPCGDWQVGGLEGRFGGDYNRFFTEYDTFRYRHENHIPGCLDRIIFPARKCSKSAWDRGPSQSRSFAVAATGQDSI